MVKCSELLIFYSFSLSSEIPSSRSVLPKQQLLSLPTSVLHLTCSSKGTFSAGGTEGPRDVGLNQAVHPQKPLGPRAEPGCAPPEIPGWEPQQHTRRAGAPRETFALLS